MKKKTTMVLTPIVAVGVAFGVTDLSPKAASVTEIEKGDTLWGISQNHGVSVSELKEANPNVDPYALPVGTEIYIELPNETEDSTSETATYTIQPGDTLWSIAQHHDGVTVNQLLDLNDSIEPRSLTVGSEIAVSQTQDETQTVYHTIQPGNTFSEIASVYDGVTVQDLMEANPNFDEYALPIGSQIKIPVK
ncbi:MAG: LysM peptidoglycan-binding domain-containing protein [Bacillaceae bacterium]|nr:LysM peptidoglycan-binding domain-containing protein [Bacillaceae bacterium]